jgi:predicted nucleotidyltransferase
MNMAERGDIPLADVLRAANSLVSERVIRDYAIGGAMAAIFYVEPFATFDIDLFYQPASDAFDAGMPQIFAYLQQRGWLSEGGHLLYAGFPVQFLAGNGLTAEAIENAVPTNFEGVPAKVFRAEHIIAIAAQVGRAKDRSRIAQMLEQSQVDKEYLRGVLMRHNLKLEGYDI